MKSTLLVLMLLGNGFICAGGSETSSKSDEPVVPGSSGVIEASSDPDADEFLRELALALKSPDAATRKAAIERIPKVYKNVIHISPEEMSFEKEAELNEEEAELKQASQ